MNDEAGKAGKTSPFYVKKWKNGWKTMAKIAIFGWIFFCWIVATLYTHTHTHTHTRTYTYKPTHYKIKLVPAGQGLLRLKGHENIIKSGDHSKKCNKNANLLSSTHF